MLQDQSVVRYVSVMSKVCAVSSNAVPSRRVLAKMLGQGAVVDCVRQKGRQAIGMKDTTHGGMHLLLIIEAGSQHCRVAATCLV